MSNEPNRFIVPSRTNSDFGEGKILWDLFRSVSEWVNSNRRIDVLDFSEVVHLKPYALALVVAMAERLREKELQVIPPRETEARDHLTRLGVPALFGAEWEHTAQRPTNVPVRIVKVRPSMGFSWEIASILEREFPTGFAPSVLPRIADSIDEVILNALGHSESPIGCVVAGQAFPLRQCVEATIVDLGLTIRGHLSRRYPEMATDETAIREAVKEGVTGTPEGGVNRLGDPNSGVGLSELKDFVETTSGELAILSGSTLVCFGQHSNAQPLAGQRFPGTVVNVRFNIGSAGTPPAQQEVIYY